MTLAYQAPSQWDKIWFNGEKMKNPWKDRGANAMLQSALSLRENNLISEALQKGWWDPENEVGREGKIRPCATQLQSNEKDSTSEFEGELVASMECLFLGQKKHSLTLFVFPRDKTGYHLRNSYTAVLLSCGEVLLEGMLKEYLDIVSVGVCVEKAWKDILVTHCWL
jgi:hypothetical protein